MRASQLDAARLDNELTAMLREKFMSMFSLFQPVSPLVPAALAWTLCPVLDMHAVLRMSFLPLQRIVTALQPELTLLLDFLVSASLPVSAASVFCSVIICNTHKLTFV